jgi:hypothetical protein
MAMAARDYVAIPVSEVSVERMFNTGRDILGVRRYEGRNNQNVVDG